MVVLAFGALASVAWLQNLSAAGLVDDTEPLFAEAARQMVVTGDWVTPQFNAQPRFDKPVLVYWLMAAMVKLFGPRVWAIRLPSALCALSLAVAIAATVYRFGAPLASATTPPARRRHARGDKEGGGQEERVANAVTPVSVGGEGAVLSTPGLFPPPVSQGRFLLASVSAMAFCLSLEAMIWGSTALSDMPLAAAIGHCLLAFFWGYAGSRPAHPAANSMPLLPQAPSASAAGGNIARGGRRDGASRGEGSHVAGHVGGDQLANAPPVVVSGAAVAYNSGDEALRGAPSSGASYSSRRGKHGDASSSTNGTNNRLTSRASYNAGDHGGGGISETDGSGSYVDAAARRARAESVQQRLRRRWRSGGTGEAWQMRWWEGQQRRRGGSSAMSGADDSSAVDRENGADASSNNGSSNPTNGAASAWSSPYRGAPGTGRSTWSRSGGWRSPGRTGAGRGSTGVGTGADGGISGGTQSYRRRVHESKGLVGALKQRWVWLSSARMALAAHMDDLRDSAEVQRRVLLQQVGMRWDAGANLAGGISASLATPAGAGVRAGMGPVAAGSSSGAAAAPANRRAAETEYPWAYPVAATMAGLAVLVKGPVGLVLPAGVIGSFLLYTGDLLPVLLHEAPLLRCIAICLATCVPWYLLMAYLHGVRYFNTFFGYHNLQRFASGVNHHGARPLWYPLAVVTGGYFPWSLALPAALTSVNPLSPASVARWRATPRPRRLLLFATFWFGFVFALFSLSSSQLPSYYLPLAPAVAILAASHMAPERQQALVAGKADNADQRKPGGGAVVGGDELADATGMGGSALAADTVSQGSVGSAEHEQGVHVHGRGKGVVIAGSRGQGWSDTPATVSLPATEGQGSPVEHGGRSTAQDTDVEDGAADDAAPPPPAVQGQAWALTGGRGVAAALTCLVTAAVYGVGASGASALPDILLRSGDRVAEHLSRVLVDRGLSLLASAMLTAGMLGATLAAVRALQKDTPLEGHAVSGKGGAVHAAGVTAPGEPPTDASALVGVPAGLPGSQSPEEGPAGFSGKDGAHVAVAGARRGGGRSRLPWLWSVNAFVMASLLLLFVRPVYVAVDKLRQEPLRVLATAARTQQWANEPIAMVGSKMPSIVFYSQSPVAFFESLSEAVYVVSRLPAGVRSCLLIVESDLWEGPLPPHALLREAGGYKLVRMSSMQGAASGALQNAVFAPPREGRLLRLSAVPPADEALQNAIFALRESKGKPAVAKDMESSGPGDGAGGGTGAGGAVAAAAAAVSSGPLLGPPLEMGPGEPSIPRM